MAKTEIITNSHPGRSYLFETIPVSFGTSDSAGSGIAGDYLP